MQKLQSPNGIPLRTPQVIQTKTATEDAVTFENYDDTDYGYLRVIASAQQLRIEYHPAADSVGVKTPDDSVTIDLRTRRQTVYAPKDLGMPANIRAVRSLLKASTQSQSQSQSQSRSAPRKKRSRRT